MDGQVVEGGQNIRCLGALINSKYVKSDEIKSKNPESNR
jgi:hypothetical protein